MSSVIHITREQQQQQCPNVHVRHIPKRYIEVDLQTKKKFAYINHPLVVVVGKKEANTQSTRGQGFKLIVCSLQLISIEHALTEL